MIDLILVILFCISILGNWTLILIWFSKIIKEASENYRRNP